MDDIEKIKRHLAKPVPIKLTNEDGCEDVFYFKPMNVEQQATMLGLSKKFQGQNEEDFDINMIDEEIFKDMVGLVKNIVRTSLKIEDEEVLDSFVTSNFDSLSEKMLDLLPKIKNQDKIELIKKKMEERKKNVSNKTE